MNSQIIELTDDSFEEEVYASDLPVLVDFWASWCGPCRQIEPIIEDLAEKYAGLVKIARMDVEAHTGKAAELGLLGIPAVLLFNNGELAGSVIGAQRQEAYEASLKAIGVQA